MPMIKYLIISDLIGFYKNKSARKRTLCSELISAPVLKVYMTALCWNKQQMRVNRGPSAELRSGVGECFGYFI